MLELHIGRLRFCFGFSFFLLLAVVCRWQAGTMLLLSFLAILLHEIGHLLAMLLTKTSVKSINFTAYGVHIVRSAVQFVPPLRLVVVYLAGPAVNLLFALAYPRLRPLVGRVVIHPAPQRFGQALHRGQFFLGVVRVLIPLAVMPAGSLDGACALREALSFLLPGRWVKPVAGLISLAVLLGLVPVMGGLAGKISPTAMLLWVYLLVATFREY